VYWCVFTFIDLYFIFFVFYFWIVYREKSVLMSIVWFPLIMGGGALILGLPGDPTQPADPNAPLAFLHVVSRWHLSFRDLNRDATSPGYGEPTMWQLSDSGGLRELHPSRVIPFRADTSASLIIPGTSGLDEFWGESVVQQVLDAVQDSDTARASFAALIHKARLLRIGIPDLISLVSESDGEAVVMNRLAVMAAAESIHNATVFDAGDPENGKGGEQVQDATYTFAGAKDVLNAYGEWVASISDIPATRLLGRAPEGMNSSGESQQKDWNKSVRARQTLELAPCLDRLDPHLLAAAGVSMADGQIGRASCRERV
jgi:phage-related protein (TIGR01555 family)